jgi:hypothetical protein
VGINFMENKDAVFRYLSENRMVSAPVLEKVDSYMYASACEAGNAGDVIPFYVGPVQGGNRGTVAAAFAVPLDDNSWRYSVNVHEADGDYNGRLSFHHDLSFRVNLLRGIEKKRVMKRFPKEIKRQFAYYAEMQRLQEVGVLGDVEGKIGEFSGANFHSVMKASYIENVGEVLAGDARVASDISVREQLMVAAYAKGADLVHVGNLDFKKGIAYRLNIEQ